MGRGWRGCGCGAVDLRVVGSGAASVAFVAALGAVPGGLVVGKAAGKFGASS